MTAEAILSAFLGHIAEFLLKRPNSFIQQCCINHKLSNRLMELCRQFLVDSRKNGALRYDIDLQGLSDFLKETGVGMLNDIVTAPKPKEILQNEFLRQWEQSSKPQSQNDSNAMQRLGKELIQACREFYIDQIPKPQRALSLVNIQALNDHGALNTDKLLQQNEKLVKLMQQNNAKNNYTYISEQVLPLSVTLMQRYVGKQNADSEDLKSVGLNRSNLASIQPNLLWKALDTDSHIVLLGDAGCGKSTLLQQLHTELKKSSDQPIFISLKFYPNIENLQHLLNDHQAPNASLVFIMDGYDEMKHEHRNKLMTALNDNKAKLAKTRMVISSRHGFGIKALESFVAYDVLPLCNEERNSFLKRRNVDDVQFYQSVNEQELQELCENAFYFVELVELWVADHTLPRKTEVMARVINNRMIKDKTKYKNIKPKMDSETYTIYRCFETTAFAMQCMHSVSLSNEQIKELLPASCCEMQCYLSLWQEGNQGACAFYHNNFLEYFSAKYLNRLSLNEQLRYVANGTDSFYIKTSWLHTFEYLINLQNEASLVQWLIDHVPLQMVCIEKDVISDKQRIDSYQNYMKKCAEEKSWITKNYSLQRRFALLCENKTNLLFSLETLEKSSNQRQLQNHLCMVRFFTSLYGCERQLKSILMPIVFELPYASRIKNEALTIMANFSDVFMDETSHLVEAFGNTEDNDIREGLYLFLLKSNQAISYIDLFLRDEQRISSEGNVIGAVLLETREKVLKSVNTVQSITKVLRYFEKHLDSATMLESQDTLCCVVRSAQKLYSGKDDPLLACIQDIAFKMYDCANEKVSIAIQNYIKATSATMFLERAMAGQKSTLNYFLREFMCDSVAEALIVMYQQHQFQDVNQLCNVLNNNHLSDTYQNQIMQAVYTKTGKLIKPYPKNNDLLKRKKDIQRYFDALFEPKLYDELVCKVSEVFGTDDPVKIYTNPWNKDAFSKLKEDKAIERCYYWLRCAYHKSPAFTYGDYRKTTDKWHWFCLEAACDVLNKYKEDILISPQQKETLSQIALEKLPLIDWTFSDTYICIPVLYTLQLLDVDCPKDMMKKMLTVPPCLFGTQKSDEFPAYVVNHLDPCERNQQVLWNLANAKLNEVVATAHVNYCNCHNMKQAKQFAIHFILYHQKRTQFMDAFLSYLYKQFGASTIFSNILPYVEEPWRIKAITRQIPLNEYSKALDDKILQLYQETKDIHWLALLIKRNHPVGLERYSVLVQEKQTLIDGSEGENMDTLTEALIEVTDVRLLKNLLQIFRVCVQTGFMDKPFLGLRYACSHAMMNMGRCQAETVCRMLNTEKQKTLDEIEYNQAITDILRDIETIQETESDRALTFDEVSKLVN